MTEEQERLAVRDAGRTWIGTPYRNRMAIKGKGIDCAQILLAAFQEAGLPLEYEPERYSSDWHLHRDEEKYLSVATRYCSGDTADQRPVRERGADWKPGVADILMWKVGKTFSHSALVTEWPYVLHASLPDRIALEVDVNGTVLFNLPMIHLSRWGTP